MHAVRTFAAGMALAAVQVTACDDASAARPAATPQVTPMSPAMPATTRVDDADARLEASIDSPSPGTVQVRYQLRNAGDAPLAVFDRGDRHAVLTKRQAAGAIGAPTFEEVGSGDVVLRHVALPSSSGGPTGPTVPATPLARRLDPGATLTGEFLFSIPTSAPPKRVCWCVGIAPFDGEEFFSPEAAPAGEVWQAGDGAVARQRVLCTPWFVLSKGLFEAD